MCRMKQTFVIFLQIALCVLLIVPCFINTEDILATSSDSKDQITAETENVVVQKCCGPDQILDNSMCIDSDVAFTMDIYRSNETHYWPMRNVKILSIESNPCQFGRYALYPEYQDDQWVLLENGSLYLRYMCDMLDKTKYCMETLASNKTAVSALLCLPELHKDSKYYFRGVLQILSVITLVGMVIYLHYRPDICTLNKYCLMFAFATMSVAYLIQSMITFIGCGNLNAFCTALYIIKYYTTLSYFIWLNMFSYELLKDQVCKTAQHRPCFRCRRKDFDELVKTDLKWYSAVAFLPPFIFTFVAYLFLPSPFEASSSSRYGPLLVFYIPTGFSIVANVCVGTYLYTKSCQSPQTVPITDLRKTLRILENDELTPPLANDELTPPVENDELTPPLGNDENASQHYLTNLYRKCCCLFWLIFIVWIMNCVIFFLPKSQSNQTPQLLILDILSDLLGVLCSLAFISKEWCQCK